MGVEGLVPAKSGRPTAKPEGIVPGPGMLAILTFVA